MWHTPHAVSPRTREYRLLTLIERCILSVSHSLSRFSTPSLSSELPQTWTMTMSYQTPKHRYILFYLSNLISNFFMCLVINLMILFSLFFFCVFSHRISSGLQWTVIKSLQVIKLRQVSVIIAFTITK